MTRRERREALSQDDTPGQGAHRPGQIVPRLDGSTRVYVDGRERVLGDRYQLSKDPRLAAEQLAEALSGKTFAYRWAKGLLEALS